MSVIGMTDVLLARIVSGRTCCLDLGEQLLLERQILRHRLDDVVGVAHRRRKIAMRRHALDRARIVAQIFQACRDARLGAVDARRDAVGDGHVMAGDREHLRDAVAHQARANDCDAGFRHAQTRRVAAVGVEDVAGVEVRRLRREEQQRPGEIGRLAQAALRHAREEARAHGLAALVVGEHPFGERRAEDRRPERVHGDAGAAPLAAERLGDAVDRRLRRAIGGVAGGMAEQPARRRHQDDLAALPLLEHLPAGGARHQPGLRDVGVHHVEEILGLLVDDLRHLVDAGGDHENVDAAERLHRGIDDAVAIGFRRRPHRHGLDLAAELGAFLRDFIERIGAAGGDHDIGAGAGQHLRRHRAERTRRAGDDRGLALHAEQRQRVFQIFVGHVFRPIMSSQTRPPPLTPPRHSLANGWEGTEALGAHVARAHPILSSTAPAVPLPSRREAAGRGRGWGALVEARITSPARPRRRWCRPRGRD